MTNQRLKVVLDEERGNLRAALRIIENSTRLLMDAVDELEKVAKPSSLGAS